MLGHLSKDLPRLPEKTEVTLSLQVLMITSADIQFLIPFLRRTVSVSLRNDMRSSILR